MDKSLYFSQLGSSVPQVSSRDRSLKPWVSLLPEPRIRGLTPYKVRGLVAAHKAVATVTVAAVTVAAGSIAALNNGDAGLGLTQWRIGECHTGLTRTDS
jgi:hypothetical protein